jgi:hypothetical protein
MPRVSSGGGALRVAGVYARLLDAEREKCTKPDPRLLRGTVGRDSNVYLRPTHRLKALEAGEPVEFPRWMLGGWTVPDERIRRMKRDDRSITGWVVHPDDTVRPLHERGRDG